MSIACFISPHGYGHAARASAVMEAVHRLIPETEFEVFTEVPEWFFRQSVPGSFHYHSLLTDIGLVQESSLKADLPKTIAGLDSFLPFDEEKISDLACLVSERRCRLILCDISPMGIVVARRAGIPSLLIENFTWDWIYEQYSGEYARLAGHMSCLREIFLSADLHVQTQPVCLPFQGRLTTSPASRRARRPRHETRARLGISPEALVAMITMGGIPETYPFLDRLKEIEDVVFIIPGAAGEANRVGNLVLLPHRSEFFHPDLVGASDALIGKVGYSTLSEVYWAGIPFGYIARNDFRESPVLVSFIEKSMKGIALPESEFTSGDFALRLPGLFALGRIDRQCLNGSDQIARFIADLEI